MDEREIGSAYIKPNSPQSNGTVERYHRCDELEFSQPLNYKGDVDLEAKFAELERLQDVARPLGASNGKTPCEALRQDYRPDVKCLAKSLLLQPAGAV